MAINTSVRYAVITEKRIQDTGMYDYLKELVEYQLYNKSNKILDIYH